MATSVTKAGLKAAADKVLVAAGPDLEIIKLFSTDFSTSFGKKGDAVAVEVLSASTEAFGSSAGYAHATNKIAPATITLTKHQKSTFSISDIDALDNELDPTWDKLAPLSAEAVVGDIVKDVMALPTVAQATQTITAANHSTLAHFTSVRKAFVDFKMAKMRSSVLILGTAAYADLLAVLPQSVIGTGDVVQNANIARFLGYKAVIEAPNMSTTSNAWGYIVPDGAIGIAARLVKALKPGGNLLESGYIQDDTTGLVLGTRVVVDADQGECFWTVDANYGCALTKQSSNGAPGYVAIVSA